MFYIETKRLELTPFRLEDAEEYFQIISDKDIAKYVPYSSAKTLDTTKKHLEVYEKGDFERDFYICIRSKETGKIIGAIIGCALSYAILDISYFIGKDYRGLGYCSEAMKAFIKYLKDNNLKRYNLLLTIEDENLASKNTASHLNAEMFRRTYNATVFEIKLT